MNDLIQRIVNAMIRQEGMGPQYVNPMNLRGAPWLAHPTLHNNFWVPASRVVGIAGGAHLVALHIAQGNSLTDFIAGHPGIYSGFAPGADNNNTVAYIKNVAEWANIPDVNVPMWNFIETSPLTKS